MINILLTCAGRRNYLVNYFRRALAGRGLVLAGDAAPSAPALQEADLAFPLPPVTAPDYLEILLSICRKYQVRLLFSLNDLELPLLSRHRSRFLEIGVIPVIPSPAVVDLCFDKWATGRFLQKIGLATPKTFLRLDEAQTALRKGEIALPLVIKPRWGTASLGIEYPESSEELALAYRLSRLRLQRSCLAAASAADPEHPLLIQEKLAGIEYGLDVVNNLNGEYVTTFVKQKLAMRSGETDKAVTVHHPVLEELGRCLGKALGHIGNLDCDVFVSEDRCWVLEMNPRFGGGYPFSHIAGADVPAACIAWALGAAVDPRWLALKPAIATAKCDRLVEVGPKKTLQAGIMEIDSAAHSSPGEKTSREPPTAPGRKIHWRKLLRNPEGKRKNDVTPRNP
ncbi:MAG: ATP-grasp domain-containing protein [Deltaproteobacteria bacterium]|nr:ATP-grasp domain-containing protein [Deltaproteobacteria bacterium]